MTLITPLSIALFAVDSGVLLLGVLLAMVGAPTAWMAKWTATPAAQFIGDFTPLINSLFLISIGWWMTKKLEVGEGDELSLRRLALSIVLGMVFIPIIFAPSMLFPYIVGKAFVFRFLALVLFIVYVILAFSSRNYLPRITPAVASFGILSLVMLLSTIFSIDPAKSFLGNYERMEGYITTLLLFGLLVSLTSIRLREFEWKKVFGVHIAVSMFVSGVAWLQYIIGNNFAAFPLPILNQCVAKASCQADSTLGNPIYLGIYAALSIWVIAYAMFAHKAENVRLMWVALIINFGALVLSGARGAWIGLVLGALVATFVYLFTNNKKDKLMKYAAIAVVALVALTGFIWSANKFGFAQNIPLVAKFASTNTLFARLEVWKTAISAFADKPILGWGQENFIHAFNKDYNPAMYGQETYFDHPHNTYLGWLAMGGLLGFIAYLLFIASVVWSTFKTYAKETSETASVGLAIAVGLLVNYLFHIFFVFDSLTSILFLIFAIAYFARGVAFGSIDLPKLNASGVKFLSLALGAGATAFLYFTWFQPVYANILTIRSMQPKAQDNAGKVLEMQNTLMKAIKLDSFGTYEVRERLISSALSLSSVVSQADDASKQAIVEFNKVAKDEFAKQAAIPYDHRAKLMYGMYLANLGDYAGAEKYYIEALALAPKKQVAILALAQNYLAKGDVAKALELYKQAVEVTPIPSSDAGRTAYNDLRIKYIQALMLAGKDQEAVAVIKDMIPSVTRADFQSLVSAMAQVYSQKKDLKSLANLLVEAQQMDPINQNFILWLAQLFALTGNYQQAAIEVQKLWSVDPNFVAQFQAELQQLANPKSQQTQAPAQTAPTTATTTQ